MRDPDEGMELDRTCPRTWFTTILESKEKWCLIREKVEDSNGIFYSIRINDIIVHIEENKDPRAFENVKVFAGKKLNILTVDWLFL